MSAESASEHEAPSGEPGGASAFPSRCARHPERFADIACVRCGDFACFECQALPPDDALCEPCAVRGQGEPMPWDASRSPIAWARTLAASFALDGRRFARLGAGSVARSLTFSIVTHLVGSAALWTLVMATGERRAGRGAVLLAVIVMVLVNGVGAGLAWPLISGTAAHLASRTARTAQPYGESIRAAAYAQGTTALLATVVPVAMGTLHETADALLGAILVLAASAQHLLFALAVGRWARGRLRLDRSRAAVVAVASIAPITAIWIVGFAALAVWVGTRE